MDNLFEFVFGVCPFALAFGVAGVTASIWEHKDKKKAEQQAQRHADDLNKLLPTILIKLLYERINK